MTQGDFEGLPGDDVEALRRFATRSNHPRGTTIFRQGERPQELLIIEKGELELIYQTRSERLVVQILYAGLERRSPGDPSRHPVSLLGRHIERGYAPTPPSRHDPHT